MAMLVCLANGKLQVTASFSELAGQKTKENNNFVAHLTRYVLKGLKVYKLFFGDFLVLPINSTLLYKGS